MAIKITVYVGIVMSMDYIRPSGFLCCGPNTPDSLELTADQISLSV